MCGPLAGNKLAHCCVSDCTLRKLPDTLMTRNAELSTYILLGALFLIYITMLQKTHSKMVHHESQEHLRIYKGFARYLLIFLALCQTSNPSQVLLTPKAFPCQQHLCAVVRFNTDLTKPGNSFSSIWHLCLGTLSESVTARSDNTDPLYFLCSTAHYN